MKLHQVRATVTASLLILMVPVAVFGVVFQVEAEKYAGCYDAAGDTIAAVPGPSCSGGAMLVGLDAPDEWTEYQVPVSESGIYELSLKCRGDYAQDYLLSLEFWSPTLRVEQTVDFEFQGVGYG